MTLPTSPSAARAPLRVWLNRSFSGTVHVIRALQRGGAWVAASHTRADAPTLAVADEGWLEPPTNLSPDNLSPDDYLAWCLSRCRDARIDVLIPERHKAHLARATRQFADLGTHLLVAADADTLALLDDKARVYADLCGQAGLARIVPEHYPVTTLDAFEEAYETIAASGRRVCFKPTVGVFGNGFRVIGTETLDELLGETTHVIDLAHLRRLLAPHPSFVPLLVMPYLAGTERSVDVVAHEGEVAAAVVRAKPTGGGYAQRLEDNPDILGWVRALVARYRLSGLVNVQFKDDVLSDGARAYLLEINTRASGGLFMALEAGVNLPYEAVLIATGRREIAEVPVPTFGAQIAQVTAPLTVTPSAVGGWEQDPV